MPIKKYIVCAIISTVSAMAGSQMVHQYYQPMNDLEDYVLREIAKKKADA